MSDFIGQQIGQYQVISLLGRGGMATVYRARQPSMGREVALKAIKAEFMGETEFMDRFRQEVKTVAALGHPHILKVFDYGEFNGAPFLVMELLNGGSLADLLRSGPPPRPIAIRMADQIGSALDYAHRRGIVHRDLKPQNVLLDDDRNAFLTDFGIAKLLNQTKRMTSTGTIMGTPAYMSPEQWQGKAIDSRSDVYAFGIMLFELIAGRVPFDSDTPFALMHKHVNEPPPLLSASTTGVSPAVDAVLTRALAKDPANRFATAGELSEAFAQTLNASTPTASRGPDGTYIQQTGNTPPPVIRQTPPPTYMQGTVPPPLHASVYVQTPPPPPSITGTNPAARPPTAANRRRGGVAGLLVFGGAGLVGVITLALVIGFLSNRVASLNTTPTLTPQAVGLVGSPTGVTATFAALIASPLPTGTPTDIPTITPVPLPTLTPVPSLTPKPPTAAVIIITATPAPTIFVPTAIVIVPITAIPPTTAVPKPTTAIPPPVVTTAAPPKLVTLNPGIVVSLAVGPVILTKIVILPSATFTPTPPPLVLNTTYVLKTTLMVIQPGLITKVAVLPPAVALGQIAFLKNVGKIQLFIAKGDGSGAKQITNGADDVYLPALSPDGGAIAYIVAKGANRTIFTIKTDGSGAKQLTTDASSFAPSWSPNGKQIAFLSTRSGGNPNLFTMNADGSAQTQITKDDTASFDWSSDGKQLVYTTTSADTNVFLINADGSNARAWGHFAKPGKVAWSSEGKQIAIESNDGLAVGSALAAGSWKVVAVGAYNPAWSPDSKSLVYNSGSSVIVLPIGGSPRKVADNGSEALWSLDGSAITFTRDGKIWSVPADGSGAPKALVDGYSPVISP